jgi:hypothetical protein
VALHEFHASYWSVNRWPGWLASVRFRVPRRSQMSAGEPANKATTPRGLPRPSSPSRRARRAHMSRHAFIGLAAGWVAGIVLLLAAALLVRGLG